MVDEDDTVGEGETIGSVDDEEHGAKPESGDDPALDADNERGSNGVVKLLGEPRLSTERLSDPDGGDNFLCQTRTLGDGLKTGDLR